MDPKMPDIKSEVNKVDDGKKKSGGVLGGLFGGGGGSTAGGLGGLGAGGAGGGGLAGMLATKTGVLALALMGSAVAGGIGLAGYKMFGPGDADRTGGNLSLFAPKPQTADPNAVAPVAADGSSQSLDMMAQSAAKDKAAEAAANASASGEAAPADKTAGDPAREAAAADAARRAADGAINKGGGNGAVGSMGKGLANVKKLGALSSASGGGASTTAGSGNASGRLGDNLAGATRNGATSAFAKGGPGAKNSSMGRSAIGGRGRGVNAQLRSVLGDQAKGKAGSSYAAGRTYDGGAPNNGGTIGPDGGLIGMDGVGDGGHSQPKSVNGNTIHPNSEFEPPPTKPVETYSPYTKAAARAQMLMMMALVLGYIASKVTIPWVRVVMGIAIMLIGAYIGVLAGQILAGKHSQGLLGACVGLTGVGTIIMGAQVMASGMGEANNTEAKLEAQAKTPDASMLPKPMLIGGAFMAVGMIGMMFNKPKPIELKPGEDPPDVRIEQKANPVRYMV